MVEMTKQGGGDTYDMDMYFQEIGEGDGTATDVGKTVDDVMEEPARIQIASPCGGVLPFNQQALQRYILHCAQNAEVAKCLFFDFKMYVCKYFF